MMRDVISGALILLAASVAVAEAQPVDDPPSLAGDPHYISDGAVTSFETCLDVADDHRAIELWNSKRPEIVPEITKVRAADRRERMETLNGLERHVKLQLGFGTIYACAQIAEAWAAAGDPLGRDQQMSLYDDGRRRHGTVVIDLALGEQRYRVPETGGTDAKPLVEAGGDLLRGTIEAVPLVRILTSPRLLPPRDFGGVVVRNAEIDGVLLFFNHRLELPLAFANVRFRGHNYERSVFGKDREPPVLDTAIAFANAHVAGHVQVSESDICGAVRLTDSHFTDTVSFRRIRQFGIGCSARTAKAAMPELTIERSTFTQGLSTTETAFGGLHVSGSRIQRFTSSHSRFGAFIEMVESQFGSLKIRCSILAKKTKIERNRVEMDLLVEGTDIAPREGKPDTACYDWWRRTDRLCHQALVIIANNHISGGFYFRNFLRPAIAGSVRLASNRVGNGSEIVLPGPDVNGDAWRGDVDLQGSTYEGTLTIAHNRWPLGQPWADQAAAQFCTEIKKGDPPTGIRVEFRAAHVRTLRWDLPLTCDYRWLGYGMTYDLWVKGRLATTSLGSLADGKTEAEKDHLALYHWRHTLSRYDSSSLSGMSDYLAGKGVYVASRDIREEAKRLNYASRCQPDFGPWECMKDIVLDAVAPSDPKQDTDESDDETVERCVMPTAVDPPRTEAVTLKDDLHKTIVDDLKRLSRDDQFRADVVPWPDRAYQAAMVFLLWPGGYGAKPEQALLFILMAAGAFFLLYVLYSVYLWWRLNDLPALIGLLSPDKSADPAGPGGDDTRRGGLSDDPGNPPFSYGMSDHSMPADIDPRLAVLVDHWPKPDDWKQWNTAQRLDRVQTDLLPATDTFQVGDLEPETVAKLEKLRGKLKRFGSTQTLGFSQFDEAKQPTRFSHLRYTIDTMLPFIDLHGYSSYYPESGFMRFMSVVQHVAGWWLMTVFIASAAIL